MSLPPDHCACVQLLWVIEAEQGKEIARATVLATERKARRRKMLEDTFDMERRAAQEKIEAMKRDNELVLVAYMTQLGFTR